MIKTINNLIVENNLKLVHLLSKNLDDNSFFMRKHPYFDIENMIATLETEVLINSELDIENDENYDTDIDEDGCIQIESDELDF